MSLPEGAKPPDEPLRDAASVSLEGQDPTEEEPAPEMALEAVEPAEEEPSDSKPEIVPDGNPVT